MASQTTDIPPAQAAKFPLFYRQPQALTAAAHGEVHLKGAPDFGFAAHANAAPIMTAEFVEAQRSYPIVFVGDPAQPSVVLGLEANNAFVSGDGAWAADRYIPAYVRRYPFVFIESADRSHYALGLDMAADRVVTGGGEGRAPLFADGQPTQFTQDALRFSAAMQQSQLASRAFCDALTEQGLLVDQQAQGALPGGKPFNVQGFRIVDAAKLQALPDAVVLDWHRKGWLALVHYHLASLQRWRDLLDRQGAAATGALAKA